MKKITKEQVLLLHQLLIKYTGGAGGVRDEGLLDSALATPFMSFDGVSLYPTIESKAARLAFGLVKNHPFIDGNKRIGILAMLSFLEANGIKIICTDEELIELGLGLAEGSADEKSMLAVIVEHN
mgnify:FL=1